MRGAFESAAPWRRPKLARMHSSPISREVYLPPPSADPAHSAERTVRLPSALRRTTVRLTLVALLGALWPLLGLSCGALGRSLALLELSWDLPMPLLAPTCTLTSQLGVNSGLNLPPKLIFPSIAVLPNLDFCNTLQCFSWFLQGGAVCCRIALGLLFCSSWTSLGRLWSPTWSVLGASWRVLGSSGRQLRSLGALLAALWTLLAALGTLLAALGTLLGRSWDALGTLLVALGCSWPPKRPSWDILGSI